MSVSGGPDIVQDGLVLYLDSSNPRCYVSGSSTCRDVVSGVPFIVQSGVRYSSAYGGEWQFPGPPTEAGLTSSIVATNNTSCTVQIWSRSQDTDGTVYLRGQDSVHYVGAYSASGAFYSNTAGTPIYSINTGTDSTPFPYLNNTYFLITISNINFSSWTWYQIGMYNNTIYSHSGSIPIMLMYNRTLTKKEVEQNYNALRSRFGAG